MLCIVGISWDIIRVLGREKGLHRLAIEDLMNKKNRSKADFYPDAAFGELKRLCCDELSLILYQSY